MYERKESLQKRCYRREFPNLPKFDVWKGVRVYVRIDRHYKGSFSYVMSSNAITRTAFVQRDGVIQSPAVKIDTDYLQRESDVRHEPLSLNLDKIDDASTRPQLGTPADPGMSCTFTCHLCSMLANLLVG